MVVCVEIFVRGILGCPVGSGILEAEGEVDCVGVFLAGMVVFTNLSCIGTLIVCWVVGLGGV